MCRPDDFPPYPKAVAYTNVTGEDWVMADVAFRTLDPDEAQRFRAWAREHYTPGDTVSPLWHPVVRAECDLMNKEDEHRYDTIEGVTPPRPSDR